MTRPQLVAPVGIRLLVLDVDDTMAPHGGLPSPEVVRALRELHADGVEIMVEAERFDPRAAAQAVLALDPAVGIALEEPGQGYRVNRERAGRRRRWRAGLCRRGTARGDTDVMSDYQITEIGPLDSWRDHVGGFLPTSTREGRRVVDHELTMQYVGMTANALAPGEQAGYWHRHAKVEELYVFLEGRGQMGLDDDVVEVGPGTVVRVGQGVWRTWRALPDSPGELRWLCIRAGRYELPHLPDDSERGPDRPMPW